MQQITIRSVKTSVIEKFRKEHLKRKMKDSTFTQADLLEELLK